jgi:predicted O-methyltransferase YrrM
LHHYCETWLAEDAALQAARKRGREVGAVPIGAGGGSMLRFLAASIGARAVVEIGTGGGTSAIWLLRGMTPDGVLTSIDAEAEHQRLARQSLVEAGLPSARYRLITGQALEVLPRLTDNGYDMLFADAAKGEYADYLAEALRLLRPGGIVAFDNALWHGKVPDPSIRDSETLAVRDLLRLVRDDDRLVPVLLPSGDGLLAAIVPGAS